MYKGKNINSDEEELSDILKGEKNVKTQSSKDLLAQETQTYQQTFS